MLFGVVLSGIVDAMIFEPTSQIGSYSAGPVATVTLCVAGSSPMQVQDLSSASCAVLLPLSVLKAGVTSGNFRRPAPPTKISSGCLQVHQDCPALRLQVCTPPHVAWHCQVN